MPIHKYILLGFFLFSINVVTQNLQAETLPSADLLLSKWKDAMYTDKEESEMKLTLVDSKKEKELQREAKIWYKSPGRGQNQILIRFTAPASIRGTAFLSLREGGSQSADQWLYFPAYKKARRLSARNPEEPFLDSDFNNGDISFDHEKTFRFTVKGIQKRNNIDVYVVEGIVKDRDYKGQYSREVLFIQKKDHLNLYTEFYGHDGKLLKTLSVLKWKKYGERWAADLVQVRNEMTGHKSIIEFTARNLKANPSSRMFTMSELESGR